MLALLGRPCQRAAVEALELDCRERGRKVDLRLFELYDLRDHEGEEVTYADLASTLDLSVTTVTNRLAAVRRRFRWSATAKYGARSLSTAEAS